MELKLTYNPESHAVSVEGAENFKNWGFVGAICGMAQDLAKFNHHIMMAASMEQKQRMAAQQDQQAARLAERLRNLEDH